MRAGSAKRRPSNSSRTRQSRYSVYAAAASVSSRSPSQRILLKPRRRATRRFYPPDCGVIRDLVVPKNGRLLSIEDVAADLHDALLLRRPIRPDVAGVVEERAVQD